MTGTSISLWTVLPDAMRSPALVVGSCSWPTDCLAVAPRGRATFPLAAALVLCAFNLTNKQSYVNQWWLVAEFLLLSAVCIGVDAGGRRGRGRCIGAVGRSGRADSRRCPPRPPPEGTRSSERHRLAGDAAGCPGCGGRHAGAGRVHRSGDAVAHCQPAGSDPPGDRRHPAGDSRRRAGPRPARRGRRSGSPTCCASSRRSPRKRCVATSAGCAERSAGSGRPSRGSPARPRPARLRPRLAPLGRRPAQAARSRAHLSAVAADLTGMAATATAGDTAALLSSAAAGLTAAGAAISSVRIEATPAGGG